VYAETTAELVTRDMVGVIAAELNPQQTHSRTRSAKTPMIVSGAKGKESEESSLTPLEEDSEEVHRKNVSKPRHKDVLHNNKKAAGNKNAEDSSHSDSGEDSSLLKAKGPFNKLKPKKRQAPLMDNAELSDDQPPKKKRKRAPKPEPVYVIPEVERKKTTFRGRLGR
jgi:UV DNA damage endonuclease